MVKVFIEGREVPRIVTYLEAPQPPPELIEQRNGQRVTVESCRALEGGNVHPDGNSEADQLARWLWDHAGDTANVAARWNGWQAATWIATNDLATVAKLNGPIEFKAPAGMHGMVHARAIEALLRWDIATKFCGCGAEGGGLCTCLDEAFAKLNRALRDGALIELGQQSLGPINRENARGMLFSSRAIRDRAAFVIVAKSKAQAFRGGSQLIDESAMTELVKSLGITSGRRLHKEQLERWPDNAWSRLAVDAWWREKVNQNSKPGPKVKPVQRAKE